jgi:hypothetical protein
MEDENNNNNNNKKKKLKNNTGNLRAASHWEFSSEYSGEDADSPKKIFSEGPPKISTQEISSKIPKSMSASSSLLFSPVDLARVQEREKRVRRELLKTCPDYWNLARSAAGVPEGCPGTDPEYAEISIPENSEEFSLVDKWMNGTIGKHGSVFGNVGGKRPKVMEKKNFFFFFFFLFI